MIRRPRIEQRILAQRSRRHQPDHLAAHDCLGPPLAGLRRVLDLLAHRDPEALADEPLEVALGAHDGDPAHGHLPPLVEAALRQRDVERLRRLARVVEEELVEIPHPVEEKVVRMGALDLEILRHHRRRRLDAAGARAAPAGAAGGGRRGGLLRLGVLGHGATLARISRHGSRPALRAPAVIIFVKPAPRAL